MKKGFVILDLFAGFGGAELSARFAKIKVEKSYISEINPSALKVLKKHFPKSIFVGDVRNLRAKDFIYVTLICAGSPCQCFSFAGKRKGMVTTTNVEIYTLKQYLKLKKDGFQFEGESYLFWEFVRLYKEITALQRKLGLPEAKFILENVEMEQKWQNIISDAVGVRPIVLDAALVSAQSRIRLFWTNIENVSIPKDMNIRLGDVIEDAVTGVGFRGRKLDGNDYYSYPKTERDDFKSNCLVTTLGSCSKKTGQFYGTGHYKDKKGKVKTLTVEQAEILQGLEEGYTNVEGVSKTARIKMIGNGWCVPLTSVFFEAYKKNQRSLKFK